MNIINQEKAKRDNIKLEKKKWKIKIEQGKARVKEITENGENR